MSRIGSASAGAWTLAGAGAGAWTLAGAGVLGLGAGGRRWTAPAPGSAASQDWPPFVLVSGLLLVGLVADEGGLFAAAGRALARVSDSGVVLFTGAVALVAGVTSLLNLDTSVAFLTPVLVYAARSRGEGEAPLLYGCLLLSNAASLLLPGSNLTNLIVLGHLHLSGARFLGEVAPAWLVSVLVTAGVVAVAERRSLRAAPGPAPARELAGLRADPGFGVATVSVAAVTALVLTLRSPALPVVAVGMVAAGAGVVSGRLSWARVLGILGLPLLVGLFGVAVALGTLGRAWSGPSAALGHLDSWATAAVAAVASVVVNNLPAASLLAARVPHRPFALLVGLDIGPNLFVTGSLAWILWLRAAANAGASPSIARASRLGLVAAPLAMGGALGVLALAGTH